MADVDEVARLCEALPEVAETKSYGHRAWAVRGKTFAWVRPFSKGDLRRFGDQPVPSEPVLGLRTDGPEEKEAILAEGAAGFFTIDHFHGFDAVLVELAVVDAARLAVAVEDAWLARAPDSLARGHLRT